MARLLYKRRINTNGSRLIIPSILIAAAVVLLAAALAQPKEKTPDDWVQLNREVNRVLQGQAVPEAEEQEVMPTDKTKEKEEVPASSGESGSSKPAAAETKDQTKASKLDINRATAEQLDTLKGIGPAKAQAIIADREQNGPYSSVDDLLRVKGIGSKLLAGIKDSIVASP